MKKRQLILGLAALAAFAALAVYGQHRYPFHWQAFLEEFQQASWGRIAFALCLIYFCYTLRSIRWALLLRHIKKVGPLSLLGTQVIGFTGVALLGRIADPVRPYLVARKTGLPLSNQVAVYIVERLLDAGTMALLFFSVILLAPKGALPHPEIFKMVARKGLIAIVAGGIFLLVVRLAGERVASFSERLLGRVSAKLGLAVSNKIRAFQTGLDTIRSFSDFAAVSLLSLLMWGLIVLAYMEIIQAFAPDLTLAKCMLLMAWGMAASALQLPVVGWFTQIGFVAAALSGFFGVAAEPATACAATLLVVSSPRNRARGLHLGALQHVSFRKVAAESEQAEEALTVEEPNSQSTL